MMVFTEFGGYLPNSCSSTHRHSSSGSASHLGMVSAMTSPLHILVSCPDPPCMCEKEGLVF